MFKLYHGDCLEIMADIPGGSVDMVLADPPYGTTACKWDSIIPLDQMWAHLKRIIKPNGAIVMTASQPFTTTLISSNMLQFKYCWVWRKSRASGFAQAKNMPLKNYEDVVVFSTGNSGHKSQCKNRMEYNPQGLVYSPRMTKNTKIRSADESAFGNRPSHKSEYLQEYTNYPSQVLEFDSVNGAVHPTQKPVTLMEYLIRTYTNAEESVLDFTMGSGTTGVACANANREFIGIELDSDYFKIAEKRISDAHNKLI